MVDYQWLISYPLLEIANEKHLMACQRKTSKCPGVTCTRLCDRHLLRPGHPISMASSRCTTHRARRSGGVGQSWWSRMVKTQKEHLSTFINMYQHLSTFINIYQHLSTFNNIYKHVSTCINVYQNVSTCLNMYQHLSTSINMYQHVSTCINMLSTCINMYQHGINMDQHASTFINMYQHLSTFINMHHHASTCNQHISTCINMFQHVASFSTCINMYQHVPTCISMYPTFTNICQHVSTFCQHLSTSINYIFFCWSMLFVTVLGFWPIGSPTHVVICGIFPWQKTHGFVNGVPYHPRGLSTVTMIISGVS